MGKCGTVLVLGWLLMMAGLEFKFGCGWLDYGRGCSNRYSAAVLVGGLVVVWLAAQWTGDC